jgi:hypothetical protein
MTIQNSEYQTIVDMVIMGVIGILIIGFVVFATRFLHKRRQELEDPSIKAKYGYLYIDLHLTRGFGTVFYSPMFFFRRLLFIAIPTLFFPETAWL